MRKLPALAILLVVIGLLGLYLPSWLRSDESQIRRILTAMVQSFNAGNARGVVRHLSAEFKDRNHSLSPEEIRSYLVAAFLSNRDAGGKFVFQAHIDPEGWSLQLDSPARRADVSIRIGFHRRGAESEVLWDIRLTSHFTEERGEWKVRSADYERLAGRRPF